MKNNNNAQLSKFSADLLRKHGGDYELVQWIMANADQIDSPTEDGIVPLSEAQIQNDDTYGLRRDYGDESSRYFPNYNE